MVVSSPKMDNTYFNQKIKYNSSLSHWSLQWKLIIKTKKNPKPTGYGGVRGQNEKEKDTSRQYQGSQK